MSDTIGDLLRFDGLAAAERITGESYKEDEGTMGLGFLLHMDHGERKTAALKATNDTYYGIDFGAALEVFKSEGFEIISDEPFVGRRRQERYVIMWNPAGILLHVESYGGDRVNSGKMHYAIRFAEDVEDRWKLTSSGRTVDGVWIGDHDIREGFRYHLHALAANGEWVSPWPTRPFLWLKNYADKDSDYKLVTERVIATLPEDVRKCMGSRSDG